MPETTLTRRAGAEVRGMPPDAAGVPTLRPVATTDLTRVQRKVSAVGA
ncbi:hypothetical protein [Salinispora arenicola]|nr:hypothetical protein [Salinispora arenicola]